MEGITRTIKILWFIDLSKKYMIAIKTPGSLKIDEKKLKC